MSIGPSCLLRSCKVEDECIIGAKSILMEGSVVQTHSKLSPGTVLPPGRLVPSGQLWAGNPARFVRDLTNDEVSQCTLKARPKSQCSLILQLWQQSMSGTPAVELKLLNHAPVLLCLDLQAMGHRPPSYKAFKSSHENMVQNFVYSYTTDLKSMIDVLMPCWLLNSYILWHHGGFKCCKRKRLHSATA